MREKARHWDILLVIPDTTTCHGKAEGEDGSRDPESRDEV
jgi:hypothetical protein